MLDRRAKHRCERAPKNWNASIPIVEAGIEEAMAHLNYDCAYSDITHQSGNNPWGTQGWNAIDIGYEKTTSLPSGAGYTVDIVTVAPFSQTNPAEWCCRGTSCQSDWHSFRCAASISCADWNADSNWDRFFECRPQGSSQLRIASHLCQRPRGKKQHRHAW